MNGKMWKVHKSEERSKGDNFGFDLVYFIKAIRQYLINRLAVTVIVVKPLKHGRLDDCSPANGPL